jgi:hypothetical protein
MDSRVLAIDGYQMIAGTEAAVSLGGVMLVKPTLGDDPGPWTGIPGLSFRIRVGASIVELPRARLSAPQRPVNAIFGEFVERVVPLNCPCVYRVHWDNCPKSPTLS